MATGCRQLQAAAGECRTVLQLRRAHRQLWPIPSQGAAFRRQCPCIGKPHNMTKNTVSKVSGLSEPWWCPGMRLHGNTRNHQSTSATCRLMGSYTWSYISPNTGYNYSYPTHNPKCKKNMNLDLLLAHCGPRRQLRARCVAPGSVDPASSAVEMPPAVSCAMDRKCHRVAGRKNLDSC